MSGAGGFGDEDAGAQQDPYDGHEQPTEHEEQIDRRYLQLHAALVDATKLDQLPSPEPLIAGILFRNSLCWLHGKPGHGKTFIALDWACHLATGEPWEGHPVEGGLVLYVLAEGATGMEDRRLAWEATHNHEIPAGTLIFLPVAVQLMADLEIEALAQLAAEQEPTMIVIDTQARVTVGADENSARDMGVFIDRLELLRIRTGACVLIVHHESRGGESLRGSTALEGAATTVIRAEKTTGGIVSLKNTKQKDAPEFDEVLGRIVAVAVPTGRPAANYSHEGVRVSDLTVESEQTLVRVLRESFESSGASASKLLAASEVAESTFYRALNALVSKGIVVNEGTKSRTRYVLTETGLLL